MKLRIEQDTDAQSPDDIGDEGLFLIARHRQFYVRPPGCVGHNFDMQEEVNRLTPAYWTFGLEAYIHSGVRLALAGEGQFPDRQWDVSRLGVVFASKAEWPVQGDAYRAAQGLIEEWNQYLSGDVYGAIVETDEGQHLDSCWGFYGLAYAKEEGARMLAYCDEHAQAEANQI